VEDFAKMRTLNFKKSHYHSKPLPMGPNELCRSEPPTQTTERSDPPGHKLLVVNVVVVASFEGEEERMSIASNVR